jgi:hypothetical protein
VDAGNVSLAKTTNAIPTSTRDAACSGFFHVPELPSSASGRRSPVAILSAMRGHSRIRSVALCASAVDRGSDTRGAVRTGQ